jgi:hypothetical protein
MSITTPTVPAESPNKMTTRSQVRSNNTSLNCTVDTELINKRDRQRKSQSNHHNRTPGLFIKKKFSILYYFSSFRNY